METWEYCSVRLTLPGVPSFDIGTPGLGDALLTITTDNVEEIVLKDVVTLWEESRADFPNIVRHYRKLKGSPLEYIQPHLSKLGSKGWEVVEYKSMEGENIGFGEALLKRKVQQGG